MSLLRHPLMPLATLVGLCVAVVLALAGAPILVILVVGVAVGATLAWLVERRAERMIRRTVGARAAYAGEFPRLHNTVDGICLTHGLERPAVYVVDSTSGNAMAMAGRGGTSMVLTTGAADRVTLVELEALVAHLLARCADKVLRNETTAAALGWFNVFGRRATGGGPDRMVRADFDGSDLTRFPPGMQELLRALSDIGAAVDVPATTARLWLLQPDGRTDVFTADHPAVGMRIAALSER
ncbi:MAG: hypothetical protein P8M16_00775 [Acidimicrobiales bacterium]|nr:hypothetical protein [Acidimicrobiales bacterium]